MSSLWFKKDCRQIPKIIELLAIVQDDIWAKTSKSTGNFTQLIKLEERTIENLQDVYDIIQNTQSLFLADKCGWQISNKKITSCDNVVSYGIKTQLECDTIIISKKDIGVKKKCEYISLTILLDKCQWYKPSDLKDYYEAIGCLKEYFRDLCEICENLKPYTL